MSTKQTDAHNQNLQDRREEDDPDSRGQELKEQAREREVERMDEYFYPSEGPRVY